MAQNVLENESFAAFPEWMTLPPSYREIVKPFEI
jgi:hypothetical protein